MNEVDALRSDDLRQTSLVVRHGDEVLGRGGKGNVQAANRLQLARKFAGIGGDERARAGLDKGRGDRECRALVASGFDRRNNLENRAAGERRVRPASKRGERADIHAKLGRQRERPAASAELTAGLFSANPARPRPSGPEQVGARSAGRVMWAH
jgi:hypothetical protein